MPIFEVRRGQGTGFGGNSTPGALLNTMGQQVVMMWYQHMILDGRAFQVRAGTITTPLVGDVVITDTAAEFSVDCVLGTTVIPIFQNISVRLETGTLQEYATKSVATVSSAGTAFVPLPLKSGGAAASTTARVQAAGAVTVTAELATTTLRHWSFANPIAAAAGSDPGLVKNWEPAVTGSPVLVGPRCLYTQIAATGTGPSYYANLDYIELPTVMIDPS